MARASLELIAAARDILEEVQPATVRAVCYRLFVAGLIDSMSRANTNAVGRLLVKARENGIIPWAWIVDETREVERVAAWDSPGDIIAAAVAQYRKDYWTAQPVRVEVWSEKGTVRGTLAPVLQEYGVPFRVMHGYGSATALHEIANQTAGNPKPLHAVYCGDWDASGLHMSMVDLPGRLERYGGEADIVREALTQEDLDGLPSFPLATKARDPRHGWYLANFGRECWELDAMSPAVLRERVAAAIQRHLDMDLWEHSMRVEAAERESMQTVLGSWRRSISMQASKYSPPEGTP